MKYLFIHVPKAGGNSFMIATKDSEAIINQGHTRAVAIKGDIPIVATVRNPYDRLVSAYFYLMAGGVNQNFIDLFSKGLLEKYTSFKDFVLHIEKDSLMVQILHLQPMTYWLCDDTGKLLADRVLKLEYPQQIQDFLRGLGLNKRLKRSNTSDHKTYTRYLDSEIISEINRLYKSDFNTFNYELR